MAIPHAVKRELRKRANPDKKKFYPRFFKTGNGEYGEGDKFMGTVVPEIRKVATLFWKDAGIEDLNILINDPIHEVRLCGLFMLERNYKRSKSDDKKKWVDVYLGNLKGVNNWDLVDLSAGHILGNYLLDKNRKIIYDLAKTDDLWKNRISVIATFPFIRNGDYKDTLKLAKHFLQHEHDLMHKAVGWMLREIGNRDLKAEREFLDRHYKKMPRTMLRYAIEKFPEGLRQKYLKGKI